VSDGLQLRSNSGRPSRLGLAPRAVLFTRQIDALAAGSLIVAEVWAKTRIRTVGRLGDASVDEVKDGD
jgi:hypothetical protein